MSRDRKGKSLDKYPCRYCGAQFTRSSNRTRHERGCLAQGGERDSTGIAKISAFNEPDIYRCTSCSYTSRVRRDVLTHINREHERGQQQELLVRRANQELQRLREERLQHQEGAGKIKQEEGKDDDDDDEWEDVDEDEGGPKPGGSGLKRRKKKKRKRRRNIYREECPLCHNFVFTDRDTFLQHLEEVHHPQAIDDPQLKREPTVAAKKFLFLTRLSEVP